MHCLEEDLAAYSSGDLRKILIALVGTYKYNGDEIDARLSLSEANVLARATKDGVFTHDEIIRIISTRSKAQLVAIFNRFKDENATSITKHFLGEDKNTPYLAAIRTGIQCITDPIKYYEKVVRNALNKAGTDEEALTRVIVTRAEKFLKEIKELYYKRNSVSLDHAVANDTSGDYERFLFTLLGKED